MQSSDVTLKDGRPNRPNNSRNKGKIHQKNKNGARTSESSSVAQISTETLLAPSFVPQYLQRIPIHRPSAVFSASVDSQKNTLLACQRLYEVILPNPVGSPLPPWIVHKEALVETMKQLMPVNPLNFALYPILNRPDPPPVTTADTSSHVRRLLYLLRMETEATFLLYERYTQYHQKVSIEKDGGKAVLRIRGIADVRPSIETGDVVVLYPHSPLEIGGGPQIVHLHSTVCHVIRGKQDKVVIDWFSTGKSPPLQGNWSFRELVVRFFPSTSFLERCFVATEWLSKQLKPAAAQSLLFPRQAPVLEFDISATVNLSMPNLNEPQRLFVETILVRSLHPEVGPTVRQPLLLTGPAGTGKTKTLLAAIEHLLIHNNSNHTRLLVCTPSHTACDVLTQRLATLLKDPRQDLFRLYDRNRSVGTVPTEVLGFTRQDSDGDFVLPDNILSFRVIVCTCRDAYILYMAGITNASIRARRQHVQKYCETLLEQGGMALTGAIDGSTRPHFTHIFIDEAAQATELETLIPLSAVVDDAENIPKVEIALAGDPRQLSSNVYSSQELQRSMLERLLRLPEFGAGRDHLLGPPTADTWRTMEELVEYSFQYGKQQQAKGGSIQPRQYPASVFLTTSYRGHPSFLIMPSRLFYFDKLRSSHPTNYTEIEWIDILRRLEQTTIQACPCEKKQHTWPMHFRGVLGRDTSVVVEGMWGSNNWSNKPEADEVVAILSKLVKEYKVSTQDIGVMAPFRAQVVLIRKLLRMKQLDNVNVGMVEDYQAVERSVVIVSVTRSNSAFAAEDQKRRAGLLGQPQRTNVALTRAEHLLVVVGDPNAMKNDSVWGPWLEFSRNNGLWYGAKSTTV